MQQPPNNQRNPQSSPQWPQQQSPSQPLPSNAQWGQQMQYRPPSQQWQPQGQYQPLTDTPPPGWTPTPPKKKGSNALLIVLSIAVAFVIGAVFGSSLPHASSPTPTTPTSTSITQQQATTAPTKAATQAPLKWTTVQNFTGSGIKQTGTFTTPSDWKILWKCDPASFGGQYNMQVYVYGSDGSLQDVAINAMCQAGTTSGETEEHQSGSVYLNINSEGSWTVTVQELK